MEFDVPDHRPGLSIFDPIENALFELYAPEPVEREPVEIDDFYFPVDNAVGFSASAVEVPKLVSTVVRSQDGELVADATTSESQTFGTGAYLVELQSTPMKLYIAVDGPMSVVPDDASVTVEFEGTRYVRVGARSFHDRPVGTITVTDDVEDAMAAVSLFGSALKTISPERSFPTLRGHPPLIERGDSYEVPEAIEKPDTGVEIVLPLDREYVFPIASLAYYLGAEVVAGTEPRLVAGNFEYSLDRTRGFEATVNRVLRQVFFLDCLTRTEGYYPVDLYERTQVESLVDLDFADLYDRPVVEQLPAYLSVPFDVLEPHVHEWHLTTDVVPVAENVQALPHLADDLSLLRTPENSGDRSVEPTMEEIDEFTRAAVAAGDFTRSTSGEWDWDDDEMFQVEPVDTIEHAWVGSGYPINANKVTLDSLRRTADRTPPDDSAIEVHVVCNDPAMAEENLVRDFYGLRDFVNYDVSIHEETTTAELAALLESPADLLHYIGHVDEEGFRCTDGFLDAESLDSVGVEAFLLNACRSYEQGRTLVEKGSRGGVVTLAEVIHSAATKVGRALARLLNAGFSLRSALNIAKTEVLVSVEYVTIGDGGLTLCENDNGCPVSYYVSENENGYTVVPYVHPTSPYGLGSLAISILEESQTRYLAAGKRRDFQLNEQEMLSLIDREENLAPILFEDGLYWCTDFAKHL